MDNSSPITPETTENLDVERKKGEKYLPPLLHLPSVAVLDFPLILKSQIFKHSLIVIRGAIGGSDRSKKGEMTFHSFGKPIIFRHRKLKKNDRTSLFNANAPKF